MKAFVKSCRRFLNKGDKARGINAAFWIMELKRNRMKSLKLTKLLSDASPTQYFVHNN